MKIKQEPRDTLRRGMARYKERGSERHDRETDQLTQKQNLTCTRERLHKQQGHSGGTAHHHDKN